MEMIERGIDIFLVIDIRSFSEMIIKDANSLEDVRLFERSNSLMVSPDLDSAQGGPRRKGWHKEAQETRDLSDGLREKFSNCQRTTTSETDKFNGGFRRLHYSSPSSTTVDLSALARDRGEGSESAERYPSKCHLSLHRFPGSSFSFKGGVFLIELVDCRPRSRFFLSHGCFFPELEDTRRKLVAFSREN